MTDPIGRVFTTVYIEDIGPGDNGQVEKALGVDQTAQLRLAMRLVEDPPGTRIDWAITRFPLDFYNGLFALVTREKLSFEYEGRNVACNGHVLDEELYDLEFVELESGLVISARFNKQFVQILLDKIRQRFCD